MSVAFAAEIVVAHKGVITIAYSREEEKEKETLEKKSTEKQFSFFYDAWHSEPPTDRAQTASTFPHAQLPAGYHHKPFTPPDVF